MFRRLYWVAEQVDGNGCSCVTGVYTSIQDLIHKGLQWRNGKSGGSFRLMLVKPDAFDAPFGVWESPKFDGLSEALEAFVGTGEYSREEVLILQGALEHFMAPVSAS